MFTEVQKAYSNMVDAVKRKILEDSIDEWKKMKSHIQIESAHLALSAGNELPRRSFDVQGSQRERPALLSSRVSKALDVRSSRKRPSSGGKKVERQRKASDSKDPKNLLKVRRAETIILMQIWFKWKSCRLR